MKDWIKPFSGLPPIKKTKDWIKPFSGLPPIKKTKIKNAVKSKRISISIDEEQLAILKSVRGLGRKEAEIVKNIMINFFFEKGYITKK